MKKLLFILFALNCVASAQAQSAKFYVTTDTLVDVRICTPIADFAQTAFPDAEFGLPAGKISLTEFEVDSTARFASLDVQIAGVGRTRYLKFMLFAGDSVVLNHQNDTVVVSGTNAAGHNLYLDKIVGYYETLPTNLIFGDMHKTKDFTEYDRKVEQWLVVPVERQMDSLVQKGLISKSFAEAAITDHRINLFGYIHAELENHWTKLKDIPRKRRKQLATLKEEIKNEQLTMSAEQAAVFPQSHSYVSFKSERDFDELSPDERAKLLGDYAGVLYEDAEKYLTLPIELRAIRMLGLYIHLMENSGYYSMYYTKEETKILEEQLKTLRKYIENELSDTEAVKIIKN